jgi:hypothetical protein
LGHESWCWVLLPCTDRMLGARSQPPSSAAHAFCAVQKPPVGPVSITTSPFSLPSPSSTYTSSCSFLWVFSGILNDRYFLARISDIEAAPNFFRKQPHNTAKMGKLGRFACIFVPMALTIASLLCLLLVASGQLNKDMKVQRDLYFFKVCNNPQALPLLRTTRNAIRRILSNVRLRRTQVTSSTTQM